MAYEGRTTQGALVLDVDLQEWMVRIWRILINSAVLRKLMTHPSSPSPVRVLIYLIVLNTRPGDHDWRFNEGSQGAFQAIRTQGQKQKSVRATDQDHQTDIKEQIRLVEINKVVRLL